MGEAERDAKPVGAPRLSPGEIAYRDFGREADGLAESEVRSFLSDVADVLAAARARELELEARVRELEMRTEGPGAVPPSPTDARAPLIPEDDRRVGALFAQLREEPAAPAPAPAPPRETRRAPADEATVEREPAEREPAEREHEEREPAETEGDAEAGGPDDTAPEAAPGGDEVLRRRRDALVAPLIPGLVRAAKRLLQDEQNFLLDAARRGRGRVETTKLLPDLLHQRDAWVEVLGPAIDVAYAGGRTAVSGRRRSANAPRRVVTELVGNVVVPLRERLTVTIEAVVAEGPYASPAELQRELTGAIGARYREWKANDLEHVLGDVLAAAYARGSYDGAPAGAQLRWVPELGTRCPDCDDNSLEPTRKGASFPTGQLHPPAHPGCRCLVVPVTGERDRRATDATGI